MSDIQIQAKATVYKKAATKKKLSPLALAKLLIGLKALMKRQLATNPGIELVVVLAEVAPAKYDVLRWTGATMSSVFLVTYDTLGPLGDGDTAILRYYDTGEPYLKGPGGGFANWAEAGIIFLGGCWNQSNQGPDQRSLGGFVLAANLGFLAPVYDWTFKTNIDPDVEEQSAWAWGMTRAAHTSEPADYRLDGSSGDIAEWIFYWPRRVNSDATCRPTIAGFAYNSNGNESWYQIWDEDVEDLLDYPPVMGATRQVMTAYNQLGRWAHLIPSPEADAPVLYSARRGGSQVKKRLVLAKPALSCSWADFLVPGSASVAERMIACLALPYADEVDYFGLSVLAWNQATLDLLEVFALTQADALAEYTFTPIPSGLPGSGPVPWFEDILPLFASSQSSTAIRRCNYSYKYGTGLLCNVGHTEYSSEYPDLLEDVAFLAEAEAYESLTSTPIFFPVISRWDLPGVIIDTAGNAGNNWDGLTYVQLPAAAPNTVRLTSIADAAAGNWPPITNAGGGESTDSDGFVWRCYLKPIQRLYAGDYSAQVTESVETWRSFEQVVEERTYEDESMGPVYEPGISAYYLEYADADRTLIATGTGTDEYGSYTFERYYDRSIRVSQGYFQARHAVYSLDQVLLWETVLAAVNVRTGEQFETDISQREILSHTTSQISPPPTGSQEVPIGQNVWKVISLPNIHRVLVLRDRREDALDGTPSPQLEIYDSTAGRADMPLLQTIPLGTQDLLAADVTGRPGWLDGDRLWDPYFEGGPRMKSFERLTETGEVAPHVMIAIWERKKFPASESGYRQAIYTTVDFSDPETPVVTTETNTSPAVSPGAEGNPEGESPLWEEWDTVVAAAGSLGWIRGHKLFETQLR
jgi:hypothetical protein